MTGILSRFAVCALFCCISGVHAKPEKVINVKQKAKKKPASPTRRFADDEIVRALIKEKQQLLEDPQSSKNVATYETVYGTAQVSVGDLQLALEVAKQRNKNASEKELQEMAAVIAERKAVERALCRSVVGVDLDSWPFGVRDDCFSVIKTTVILTLSVSDEEMYEFIKTYRESIANRKKYKLRVAVFDTEERAAKAIEQGRKDFEDVLASSEHLQSQASFGQQFPGLVSSYGQLHESLGVEGWVTLPRLALRAGGLFVAELNQEEISPGQVLGPVKCGEFWLLVNVVEVAQDQNIGPDDTRPMLLQLQVAAYDARVTQAMQSIKDIVPA